MRIAIDSATDRPVFASEVRYHQAGEEFLCPCCGENVTFVPRRIQQAHFRHWPNVADDACIEYVGADSLKLSGFLLKHHLEHDRQVTIGIATKEIYVGALTGLEWYPFARFRPKEGNRAIRCLDPALPSLRAEGQKPRFIPLGNIQKEYSFRIENRSGPPRNLKVSGFDRPRIVLRHIGGFWAILDATDNLASGEFLVLSEDDFSLITPPPGIEITLRGSKSGSYLLAVHIAERVTQRMMTFCQKQFGHHLTQKSFDCSNLTEGVALSLGPTIWQLSPGQPATLLLRSGASRGEMKTLVFESACDKTRTQQSLSFFDDSAIIALGKLQPGRHILACVSPEEIIAVFEVPRFPETVTIPAVQFNIKKDDQTRCYYWASEGLKDALLEVRSGAAEIDRLILPFGLSLEAVNRRSQIKAPAINRDQLTDILRSAKPFNDLKVTSDGYHIRGFPIISLILPEPTAPSRKTIVQQNSPFPRTPFQASLADAVRRGALSRYALSAMGARL